MKTNNINLLTLINKKTQLSASYKPPIIVLLDNKVPTLYKGLKLAPEPLEYLINMYKDTKRNNMNLIVSSAYRSYSIQAKTYLFWKGLKGKKEADKISALPGHSEHQLGTTVDFTSTEMLLGFTKTFDKTREGKWLRKNAHKYGFIMSYPKGKEKITGYIYEPWHWRYIGVENAKKMIKSGLSLEEFVE